MISFSIKKQRLLCVMMGALIAAYCFYCYGLQPYFLWKNYDRGIWKIISILPVRSLLTVMIVILGSLAIAQKINTLTSWLIFASWMFVASVFGMLIAGARVLFGFEWLILLTVTFYIAMPKSVKIMAYRILYNVYTFLLIVPIVIYILVHLGIHVPYVLLESNESIKVEMGIRYKIYPLACQWTGKWNDSYYSMRMCGVYHEPGAVGTFCALFLCAEQFKIKGNLKNIIILLGGIFSFSLAFYAIIICYIMVRFLSYNWKYGLLFIAIILLYFVFMSLDFKDENITKFQMRFSITSSGLAGNNRTNSQYDAIFQRYLNGDLFTLLFGKGNGAIEVMLVDKAIDGASYKNLLYNFGLVGFLNQLIWLLSITLYVCKGRNRSTVYYCLSMLVVYLANMYQRPTMYGIQYLVVMLGADLNYIEIQKTCRMKHKTRIVSY